MKLSSSKADYEDVADEIYRLCEKKQKVQLESAGRDDLKKRISNMGDFTEKWPFLMNHLYFDAYTPWSIEESLKRFSTRIQGFFELSGSFPLK